MAVAFDKSTASNNNPNVSSVTFAHIVSGSNRALVVFIGAYDPITPTDRVVSSITYGGVSLTLLRATPDGGGGGLETWYLNAPATGTNNVVVTMGGITDDVSAHAASFTGVKQSGQPEAATYSLLVGTATATVTVGVLTTGSYIVGAAGANSPNWIPDASQTEMQFSASRYFVDSYKGPLSSGNQAHTYTGNSGTVAIHGIALAPVPATTITYITSRPPWMS